MSHFQFKQFIIYQEKAAMKVGTDGVLLGAWADISDARTILDVGTGTGLIALMSAQKNDEAKITGIEVDELAYKEACRNVEHSKWNTRIQIVNQSLQKFASSTSVLFDCIICNPPFYNSTKPNTANQRNIARQDDSLPLAELATNCSTLLTKNGRVYIIYPSNRYKEVKTAFASNNLWVTKICMVKPTEKKPPKRVLLQLEKVKPLRVDCDELVIEPHSRHKYSKKYIALTKQFYLNF